MHNITEQIRLLSERTDQSVPDCHVYVVGTPSEFILVDTGNGLATPEKIADLAQNGFDLAQCKAIILTHIHFDHCNGAKEFNRPVHIHELEANLANNPTAIFAHESFAKHAQAAGISFHEFDITKMLKHGDLIGVGDQVWRVVHTPGHTRGSMCLYNEDEQILISGDTLFADSIGRTDFFTSNTEEMRTSLYRLGKLNVKILLPGHGEILTKNTQKKIQKTIEYFRAALIP